MKAIPTLEKVKIAAVLSLAFLSSCGLSYSIIKFLVTDQPQMALLLPLFMISAAILIKLLFNFRKTTNHQ